MWEGSWLDRSGQRGVYAIRQALVVVGAMPALWYFVHKEFDAMIPADAFMFITILSATGWACYKLRCRVCQMPIYAMRLLGLPRADKQWFERLSECPYCLDDGTGDLGDLGRVDRAHEIGRAWAYLRKACLVVLAILGVFLIYIVLGVSGVLPV